MTAVENEDTFSIASSMDDMDEFGIFNDTGFFDGDNGADGALPNLLLDQLQAVRSDAIKNIAATVRVRQSFRKRSSAASLVARDAQTPKSGQPSLRGSVDVIEVGDFRTEESEASMVPFSPSANPAQVNGSSRARRKLAQLVDAWVSSAGSGENASRVKQMKDILTNHHAIANEFLLDECPPPSSSASKVGTPEAQALELEKEPRGNSTTMLGVGSDMLTVSDLKIATSANPPAGSTYGGAYRMLEEVLLLKRDATSDSRAAQAFEVLYAAATVATDWPMPLPTVVTEVLDAVLGGEWRLPLTSFLAIRLIIALSPSDALNYCRIVLTNCLHFQFRVVDAAMVCVAEEAVEGTSNLTKPEGWVAPVLAWLLELKSIGSTKSP